MVAYVAARQRAGDVEDEEAHGWRSRGGGTEVDEAGRDEDGGDCGSSEDGHHAVTAAAVDGAVDAV